MEIISTGKTWTPERYEQKYYQCEMYTKKEALPDWWNEDDHAMIEYQTFAGPGFKKYCIRHKQELPDSGCAKCKLN